MSSIIQHQGIVQNINNNEIEVMIISESACSSCKSKKVCAISEIKEKIIRVETNDKAYKIGDNVTVFLEEKMGAIAVIFAYVLPFIVMITILVIGSLLKLSEPVIGGIVIVSLLIYYIALYLFKNQFNKRMTFRIGKQEIESTINEIDYENTTF